MVPVVVDASGEVAVDWPGMTRLGEELFAEVLTDARTALGNLSLLSTPAAQL
ncbi:hypothetical protein CVCC1112_712 [Paenarthrobacter nicotinovorans]|nr:hypothetical protein CVCC1112_712 [Paenarthrobacter nicotinovorans]